MLLPKISVIIPWYNYARYVGQAIDSALGKCYPALDLVVVNDGSTDESLSVIRRHAPSATIIDQPNRGYVAACNAGFAACTGDVVAFLDADDLLEPSAPIKVAQGMVAQPDLTVCVDDGQVKPGLRQTPASKIVAHTLNREVRPKMAESPPQQLIDGP